MDAWSWNVKDVHQDDDAVEPVERGLEVDPGSEGVHPDHHLRQEEAEKDKLGVIWNKLIFLEPLIF